MKRLAPMRAETKNVVLAHDVYKCHERRMQRAVRTLNEHGWRQRLAPLAEHMGNRRLGR